MSECAVKDCTEEGTETIEVAADRVAYQPRPYVMEKVLLDVPLCPGHHELLMRGVYSSLSVG